MATLQAGYPADPEMTGRSILSAAMRTRVATRPGGNDATGGGGPPEPSGGSVISGLGVAETAASGLAVAAGVVTGSAAAVVVRDSTPAARKVTPSAVRSAGAIRVRIRSARWRMGPAW